MAESPKFPLNQLGSHLKCTDCQNHLSIPPIVVLKNTGEYKCGRCSLTGQDRTGANRTHPKELAYKNAVRDSPYEELARDLFFPCKNRKYGCETWAKFRHLAVHETRCPISHNSFQCPVLSCEFRYCGFSIYEHCQIKHQAEMCVKKWHSHVFAVPNNCSDGITDRVFFSSDNKIMFWLVMHKSGREYAFTLRSFGANQLFQFEIKPGKFRNNNDNNGAGSSSSSSKRAETLFSNPLRIEANSAVKLKLQEDEANRECHEFQVDFVGKMKPERLVKLPVKESDAVKCVKCRRYLSVKPVVATKNGFECGGCFKRTEAAAGVRMKAYESLAEMVVFPCEEPGCDVCFGIGEMKKHKNTHKSSE